MVGLPGPLFAGWGPSCRETWGVQAVQRKTGGGGKWDCIGWVSHELLVLQLGKVRPK